MPPESADSSRVLVVDDDEHNRDMLTRRLQRRGYTTQSVASGAEALTAISRESFDLIVLDVMMPEMDGLEVLQHLRQQFSKLELPVIMATALDESRDAVEALERGANDYATKPIDFAQLDARIQTHLTMRREYLAMRGELGAKVRSTDSMSAGTILDGRYEVEERIGQGGFAVVYRARQLSTGQRVALKVLRASRALRSGGKGIEYARFQREMQVIATVRHPAIVRLIDSGSLELEGGWAALDPDTVMSTAVEYGTFADADQSSPVEGPGPAELPYFVMEYLEGETLDLLLARDGPLPLERAFELFFPILEGVHALNRRGIIHRDLKPSNVFLHRWDGRRHSQPKVLDFGIAKLTQEDNPVHATIGFVGTPAYMSPEQAMGQRDLDARVDQYALGVMLYECLSGRRPFTSDNFTQVLIQITDGEYPPLRELCDVPLAIDAIVSTAMHHDRAQRYPDLVDFAQALLHAGPEALRTRFGSLRDF